MILVYPAVLVLAAVIARRSPRNRRGPGWFAAWAVAGMLFAFSLATGFSIGLFLLPVAAVTLFWVAARPAVARGERLPRRRRKHRRAARRAQPLARLA